MASCAVTPHHINASVRIFSQSHGVSQHHYRGCINYDVVRVVTHLVQKILHGGTGKQISGSAGCFSRCEHIESCIRQLSDGILRRASARKHFRQSISLFIHLQDSRHGGIAHISVHKEDLTPRLCKGHGQIDCRCCFSFSGNRAGYQYNSAVVFLRLPFKSGSDRAQGLPESEGDPGIIHGQLISPVFFPLLEFYSRKHTQIDRIQILFQFLPAGNGMYGQSVQENRYQYRQIDFSCRFYRISDDRKLGGF